MSLAYRVLYRVGFTPWEQLAHLPAANQIRALLAHEEEGRNPPYGEALDLGCGRGIWSVELAARGWDVTAIDFVPQALRQARERARKAKADVRFVEGDVTRLRGEGIGASYQFLLDLGLFHDELTDEQRAAMAREVTAVSAPGASLLMMAWAPGRRGPLPRGAGRADIEAAFTGWKLVDEEPVDTSLGDQARRGAISPFYRIWKGSNPCLYRLSRE